MENIGDYVQKIMDIMENIEEYVQKNGYYGTY